jgi:hypothetical protein
MSTTQELGHRYLAVLNRAQSNGGSNSDHRPLLDQLPRPATIDPFITTLMLIMNLPCYKKASRGVFLSGRVYDAKVRLDGQESYRKPSEWRQEVSEVIRPVAVPLHGLAMSLHLEDVGAGAGLAFLRMLTCPLLIIDARGRVGPATIEEANIARQLGHRIGLLLPKTKYQETRNYLQSGEGSYPEGLPAYRTLLSSRPQDLIEGEDNIVPWINRSRQEQSVRELQGRYIPLSCQALIWYYIATQLEQRPEDLAGLRQIVDEPLC